MFSLLWVYGQMPWLKPLSAIGKFGEWIETAQRRTTGEQQREGERGDDFHAK
jgi:hypothetical protein